MGIRQRKREVIQRLAEKTLETRFVTEVSAGLNCSPFEARAVLGVVQEVFAPLWRQASSLPGRTVLMAVDADEPAGKPVKDCQQRMVILQVHRGAEDDRLLQRGGPRAFRRARLPDLCQVALSQGGLLTAEDLAYRVFFVTPRTISRDLAALRQAEPGRMIPMRRVVGRGSWVGGRRSGRGAAESDGCFAQCPLAATEVWAGSWERRRCSAEQAVCRAE